MALPSTHCPAGLNYPTSLHSAASIRLRLSRLIADVPAELLRTVLVQLSARFLSAHFCTPISSARALARNYPRDNAIMTPKQAQHRILKRVAKADYCKYLSLFFTLFIYKFLLNANYFEFLSNSFHQLKKVLWWNNSLINVFAEVQGGHALLLFFALIKESQRNTYDRQFKYVIRYQSNNLIYSISIIV
uniref:F-box domain-containing protein n=1 Tax=Heterorhabditis bacteriophora TaxID=37862 RepID=A0A1I7W907_HETBA